MGTFYDMGIRSIPAHVAKRSPYCSSTSPREVDADTSSALIVQKAPLRYPDAALKARIEGTVVLKIVISSSGDVEEVTVVSGDPALAQAASEAVKQWKYKPYLADGSPAEMETQVTIGFHLKTTQPPAAPPLGTFNDDAYSNDYFGIFYPLSRDWVRETDLMRSKIASEGNSQGTYVLLAAVHIPQDSEPMKADSSFMVLATNHSGAQDCKQYLEVFANSVQSQKDGKPRGDVSQFTIAGHDFYRRDFEFRHDPEHRTFLCTSIKDSMLQWNIVGLSRNAIETAVSTLRSITTAPPPPATTTQPPPATVKSSNVSPHAQAVRVSSGVSVGLLIKKVVPVYPPEAKYAHIQGSVVMKAVINKAGDVVDLEVNSGPIELVVSAVNAVRKWKYRPYLLLGNPVEVQTQIVVNYSLRF